MAKTETNVDNLKINYLTKEQYDEALASGSINLNEMYITPEEEEQGGTSPVTTSGTGDAYAASVPNIKVLTAGVEFTMIPHVVSDASSPTLNVNGLGAKAIRQRLSNSTQSTAPGSTANWLAAGKPVRVMYDGSFWIADLVRTNMSSAYGVLPVENGGTGVTTDKEMALKSYPVGSVYISYTSTSPSSLFGGTWTPITGRFPYFNAGTSTGGSNTHTLSTNEMPSHYHGMRGYWSLSTSVAGGSYHVRAREYISRDPHDKAMDNAGGGAAHNNMPAYQTLYAWRRTA